MADLDEGWLRDDFDVTVAGGERALEASADSVDAVCLDRRLPGPSGDTVLGELRERDLDRNLDTHQALHKLSTVYRWGSKLRGS